jgi:hypothetical protein
MPWHISTNIEGCSGYAVVKDDDGSVEGCHPTRTAANRQLAALHASEADKSSKKDEDSGDGKKKKSFWGGRFA